MPSITEKHNWSRSRVEKLDAHTCMEHLHQNSPSTVQASLQKSGWKVCNNGRQWVTSKSVFSGCEIPSFFIFSTSPFDIWDVYVFIQKHCKHFHLSSLHGPVVGTFLVILNTSLRFPKYYSNLIANLGLSHYPTVLLLWVLYLMLFSLQSHFILVVSGTLRSWHLAFILF